MIIIGHRGARGLAPENTLASFDKAIACGVDYIEFDVRLTRDQRLVVIHDRHTGRVAEIKRYVAGLTFAQTQALLLKEGAALLPLEKVLDHVVGRVKLQIELKSWHGARPLAAALQPYLTSGKLEYPDFMISSFSLRELTTLHRLNNHFRLALLHRWWPRRFMAALKQVPLYAVGFRSNLLQPAIVRAAKQRGLMVYAYNTREPQKVNEPSEVRKLAALGVDGVCTDRPDIIRSSIAS